jgi:hypothetical protein
VGRVVVVWSSAGSARLRLLRLPCCVLCVLEVSRDPEAEMGSSNYCADGSRLAVVLEIALLGRCGAE